MSYPVHLVKWQKSKILATSNVGKNVKEKKFSFIVGEKQNGKATLEDSLAVSYKTSHTFTIKLSTHFAHAYKQQIPINNKYYW